MIKNNFGCLATNEAAASTPGHTLLFRFNSGINRIIESIHASFHPFTLTDYAVNNVAACGLFVFPNDGIVDDDTSSSDLILYQNVNAPGFYAIDPSKVLFQQIMKFPMNGGRGDFSFTLNLPINGASVMLTQMWLYNAIGGTVARATSVRTLNVLGRQSTTDDFGSNNPLGKAR